MAMNSPFIVSWRHGDAKILPANSARVNGVAIVVTPE